MGLMLCHINGGYTVIVVANKQDVAVAVACI